MSHYVPKSSLELNRRPTWCDIQKDGGFFTHIPRDAAFTSALHGCAASAPNNRTVKRPCPRKGSGPEASWSGAYLRTQSKEGVVFDQRTTVPLLSLKNPILPMAQFFTATNFRDKTEIHEVFDSSKGIKTL